MKTVNVHEAKTELAKLLTEVEEGGEFIIARGDKPIARVVPFERAAKPKLRTPGALAHLPPIPDGFFFDPLPEGELLAWEGEHAFDSK